MPWKLCVTVFVKALPSLVLSLVLRLLQGPLSLKFTRLSFLSSATSLKSFSLCGPGASPGRSPIPSFTTQRSPGAISKCSSRECSAIHLGRERLTQGSASLSLVAALTVGYKEKGCRSGTTFLIIPRLSQQKSPPSKDAGQKVLRCIGLCSEGDTVMLAKRLSPNLLSDIAQTFSAS